MATNEPSGGDDGRGDGGRGDGAAQTWREVPIDWEALEDAFENNAPEVHSYLHVPTGDVLRIVDGIADPQMHARIAADVSYLRIEPVSSREQYRWMERYIPMVEDRELQGKLTKAIDGKGAFRRFKDVLMGYGPERERWFSFRSERLRIFMEAWLNAHALNPIKRPVWAPDLVQPPPAEEPPQPPRSQPEREARRARSAESFRRQLRDIVEALGPRELETLSAFGEFLRSRRVASSRRGSPPPSSSGGGPAPDSSAEAVRMSDPPPTDRPGDDKGDHAARQSDGAKDKDDKPSSRKVVRGA